MSDAAAVVVAAVVVAAAAVVAAAVVVAAAAAGIVVVVAEVVVAAVAAAPTFAFEARRIFVAEVAFVDEVAAPLTKQKTTAWHRPRSRRFLRVSVFFLSLASLLLEYLELLLPPLALSAAH